MLFVKHAQSTTQNKLNLFYKKQSADADCFFDDIIAIEVIELNNSAETVKTDFYSGITLVENNKRSLKYWLTTINKRCIITP